MRFEDRSLAGTANRFAALMLLGLAVSAGPFAARAHGAEQTGKEVVDTVCAKCHATGVKGAPKIGDERAWAPLAKRGLTSLSESALNGIRNMPAHGGSPGLSDVEIERAIVYMVNAAGGNWVEPLGGITPAVQRKGKQIVENQCAKCHRTGVNGAPKIGNLNDWIPRLRYGIDLVVRSAINGHGPMPARGGVASLTDREIRSAVTYMINPAAASAAGPAPVEVTVAASNRKIVDGMEVFLGVVPAETLRQRPKGSKESTMHGGVPSGKDYYHVNVSLFDQPTRAVITDAQIEVTVADPVRGSESKKLEPITIENVRSYGNYFRMASGIPHPVKVVIRRPGMARAAETEFTYKPY